MSPFSIKRLYWAGPVATIIAILVDLLYYAFTKTLGEQYIIPLDASTTYFSPMPVLMPVMAILVPGLVATVFFGVLVRFSKNPAIVFISVAVAALILSLGGPLYIPNTALHTKLLLSGMQLIAAVLITGGILLMSRQKTKLP
jgi:hypothetical protein